MLRRQRRARARLRPQWSSDAFVCGTGDWMQRHELDREAERRDRAEARLLVLERWPLSPRDWN